MRKPVNIVLLLAFICAVFALGACDDQTNSPAAHKKDYEATETNRAGFHPYIPKHAVEFSNYNKAQELYDNPSTIIWCTTTWPNPSSPLVTIPIAGKLTSSTVSFFPNRVEETFDNSGSYYPELTSVDGMYHGSPPPYRFGFTPGGHYAEFNSAMPTLCTTALNSFQRTSTNVTISIDKKALKGQKKAEAALAEGQKVARNGSVQTAPASKAAAQQALETAVNGG